MEQVEDVTAAGTLISVVCVGPVFPLNERRGKTKCICEMTSMCPKSVIIQTNFSTIRAKTFLTL